MIGHLENESEARTFSDYLYGAGIDNQVEMDRDGSWALWIQDEDKIAAAKGFLDEYRSQPADPKFRQATRQAQERRETEATQDEAARKRFHDSRNLFPQGVAGVGWLTMVVVVVSVSISLLSFLGWEDKIVQLLFISYYLKPVLPEIMHGEVWRLVTPILVHAGMLHLIFNMMWMLDLGSMIERRQSARLLALLILVIAIPSNLAQYFKEGPAFCGMSGVVYGLIGYIWMRGKFDPASGLFLHSNTVMMAVVWYFLCLFRIIPHVANTVHTVGFAIGLAWGFVSAQIATRRLP